MTEAAVVYSCWRDPVAFRNLRYASSDDALPSICFDLYGLSPVDWPVPQVVMDNTAGFVPDIWWLTGAGTIALELEVADELQPFLGMAGELLPLVEASGQLGGLHALNLLNVVDALDLSRSDPEHLVVHPDFLERRLGEPTLFMVPQLLGTFFCVDWQGDDSLKRRVDRNRLQGLEFEEVWTSTSGARPVNLMRPPG